MRLDAQIGSGVRKSGKTSGKAGALGPTHVVELLPHEPLRMVDFTNSGLGQLIMMLLSETFHKIPDLSDRLLRLIASIAVNVHKRDLGNFINERKISHLPCRKKVTAKRAEINYQDGEQYWQLMLMMCDQAAFCCRYSGVEFGRDKEPEKRDSAG